MHSKSVRDEMKCELFDGEKGASRAKPSFAIHEIDLDNWNSGNIFNCRQLDRGSIPIGAPSY